MHQQLREYRITCPWCWEVFSTWLEAEAEVTELIEDCQVCCHPMQIRLHADMEGKAEISSDRAV